MIILLQMKKIKNLKAAFKMFNNIQRRPGKGDITYMELQVNTQQHIQLLSEGPRPPVQTSCIVPQD